MDGVMCSIMARNETPSVLINLIRSQCVVVVVKRLKVLATCRELWVSGKPSNWSARQMDIHPHSLVEIGFFLNLCCNNYGCREGRPRCSRGEWRCPWTGMRSKRLLVSDSMVLQVCVLGLPLQGWKFDSESSVSRGYWDCLIPLPHRVRSETKIILNLVECN